MEKPAVCPSFISEILSQCKSNPSRIAVVDGDGRRSSYGDFLDIIERTSGYIRSKGIPAGSFIVINLQNSMEYLAVEFGVFLSGCTIVPVNPLYPKARIEYITEHCDARLVVDDEVLRRIEETERFRICSPTADIAALFYTSGSTGTPKGVIHTFESISHIDRFEEVTDVRPDDVLALGAPFSFIAWVLTIPFLRKGAAVRLIPRDTMTDIRKLQEFYDNEHVTGAFINPSTLRQLSLDNNHTLRFVVTGSERVANLSPKSSYRLINIYGMTETCAVGCCFDIKKPYPNTPIGKPVSDLELKIMDDGEICFRGPLAPGYFKDAERSAQLWSGGWMHTGDIGRRLPDGNIEYVNRKDWMVKINGQRVETGEIIQVIKEMAGVSDATAKGFASSDGHQYIVAYYVADDSVSEESLREFISRKLAPYMIPSYFVRMDALPLNFNGKVDVKSLQSPLELGVKGRSGVVPPQTERQKNLCCAFETALGISPVGIDDDFLSLGGDSIRVMQLQVISKEKDLTSSMVYKFRTVRKICEALEQSDTSKVQSPEVCPLSQTQKGIFVECMNRRGEAVYNNPLLYRFADAVDAQLLGAACVKAVSAHPNLFASIFLDTDGIPRQKKNGADGFEVKVETVSNAEFERLRKDLMQPFDILNDRLFRIRIFKTESDLWLFTDFHHIIYDGSSNDILIDDIERAYNGAGLEMEEYTGFDVAYDEEIQRGTPFMDECRKWNSETFCEVERTSLPDPDRFNDTVSFGKMETPTGISAHAFSKAAERLGVTENVLATGAFGYMLGACSHSMNSAFATVYNGRKSVRTSRTMSMMVKTLPVYCKWNAQTRLGEYMSALKDQMVGSMAHDLFSFAEICAGTAYDSRVLFTYQADLLSRDRLCGSRCEMTSLLESATGEPFTVQLYKENGSLCVRTEYRNNMYSDSYVSSLISCFTSVLSSLLLMEKDDFTGCIALVGTKEKKELLGIGWGDKLDFDRAETFVSMFRKQAKEHPDEVAVVDEEGCITYAELDRKSDFLASALVAKGVGREDFVALMLPRLRLYPVAYIACFKSGAAFVPMDFEYPLDRLQYMIDDSSAKVLLTTKAIFDAKSEEGGLQAPELIFVDEILSEFKPVEAIDRSSADSLAYMIYTSGTTGRPKGVMIEHHCLTNLVHWASALENVGPGCRIAEHASFSFDGSIIDLMTPLCMGAQMHILAASLRKDLPGMYRYFCENKIDGVVLTTQLGLTMLRMYDLKLKFMMLGGEKMSGPFKTKVHLYNGYGPTEFTVCSSYYLVDPENVPDNIPIGRAVPNTLSAVVDAMGRLLPRGVAGELVLVGEQLARGYWHREDITSERFTPCPFVEGEKMYHTGDLVKWDEDGQLLFLGRIDTQVKLRGFRIELGEVESTLLKYDGVKSAVVAVKEISGLQHLCAYYCSDVDLDEDDIRTYLASSLTDYMVPTAYVRMDALPMTPNGKVDLRSLPIPSIKAEEIVKPADPLEEKLFAIVSEFLRNEDFGVTTNLVSMGMTSLGAITLSVQIENKVSLSIPSSKMLECPTIRQWAGIASAPEDTVPQYEKQDFYPLTDNQLGVYIDWQQHKDSTQYNVPMLFHFNGVPAETVAGAVRSFVAAHPYIKTRLKTVDGQVVQCRRDDERIDVPVTTLDCEPDKAFFQRRLRPFDLFTGPMCRFEVFAFEDRVWLLTDVHHIVFDGGSEAIFAKEMVDSCNGLEIAPEDFSAFDYSLYYGQWKESEDYTKARQYFSSLLEGTVAGSVPSSSSCDGVGSANYSLSLPREPLRRCCRENEVTENAFFLTVISQVLHRFTREDNLAILTVSSGRSLLSLKKTCGMFVQTLPVVSHHGLKSVGEALKSMHSQVVETLARDKFPYTKIVELTGVKPDVLVAYQGDVMASGLSALDQEVTVEGLALDTAKFPVSINVVPGKDETDVIFEYDRALYSESDIRRFADAVRDLASNIVVSGKDTLMNDLSCVGRSTEDELVRLGSGEKMDVDAAETVVRMFSGNAREFPDFVAVVDCDGKLSYRELDKFSDMLAAKLLSGGVGKEDFVALMLPRRKEYVIAYLAVLKSGAAFVPMDYEYPFDRLQYMVDDSASKVLVTTSEIFAAKKNEGEIKVDKVIFIDKVDFSAADKALSVDLSQPQGLAYMIYTSGTTGKPKGVMIEHHSVVNMTSWNSRLVGVGRGTRVAQHASFSFDASILDLMTCIAFGGELHILDEQCRKDPERIYKYFCDNAIEVTTMSTQLGMMMLNSYKLPIKAISMGGEKLTGKYPGSIKVINGYGPTEFTVCSSYHVVDPVNEADNIPIGRAVPNTVSAVVDPFGRLLPEGVAGELVLVGPQLARGYWNKEDITAKRFVPCPFIPGEKMYRTGDLVRWSEDGELLFIGRIDTQVKLRGFRIELGEIESVMTLFDGVASAVAQVKEVGGVQHLCAYYTANGDVDEGALKTHLSSSLTSYMVPDALIRLDELPLTPNGKVDMKKLPLPEISAHSSSAFEPAEGELEETIARAFSEVLGTSTAIGRNDSFFLLGGTSLLVMKVIVILSDKGYTLTYSDVFKYPTPRTLAAFIEGFQAGCAVEPLSPEAPVGAVGEELVTKGDDGYDYSAINGVLDSNRIECIDSLESLDDHGLGDVLLLGATGFLGIHILHKLLNDDKGGKVYCIIRGKKGVTCEGRLKAYLMYYFDNTHSDLLGKRLFVIEGDMTEDSVMDKLMSVKVDTVINCAANVKHFAAGDEIGKVNLSGTEKLIEYCLKTGSRLVHTSTHSVSGQMENAAPHVMKESDLYYGQKLMTKYQISKFQAERAILEACTRGLKAKIMRLGNLMPRLSDGEFQINLENNGFMARMRAYYLIGCIASGHLHSGVEFAPIDQTADAVLILSRTPDKFTVFHPYNNHSIYIDDVIAMMRKCSLDVKVTDDRTFSQRLNECLKDDHLNPYITSLLAYGSHNSYVVNPPSQDFTINVLNAMDWRWAITGSRYLSDALEKMKSLEYFNK